MHQLAPTCLISITRTEFLGFYFGDLEAKTTCEDQLFKVTGERTLVMSSGDDIFAEPMLDTDEYLEKYMQQLIKLDKQGLLPDLTETLRYKVYSIQGSGISAHKSIVLSTNDEQFVSVELGIDTIKGRRHIYPVTRKIDKDLKPEMEYLGVIEATGEDLIAKAIAVMKHFGRYFMFGNNCHDFCDRYLEAIGLKEAQTVTDADKVGISAIIASIIPGLFAFKR